MRSRRSFTLMALAGLLWMSAGLNRADEVVEPRTPAKEKTLAGTLSWQKVKKRNGSTTKGTLLLDVGERRLVLPLTSKGTLRLTHPGARIDVEKYVGKRVKLTAMVIETARRSGTSTVIKSVTRIEEGV